MRIRSHILEDESRVQFRLALPIHWVMRDKPNDYGIDCEVEIFDEEGLATGHIFWVQLKATDSTNKKKNRSFQIEKSKLIQLVNYPVPVLFARYLSAEKKFYIKWANKVYLLNLDCKTDSLTVDFDDESHINMEIWTDIETYLAGV